MTSVKQAFDELLGETSFGKKLYKRLHERSLALITKNEQYTNLFGGKLIGSQQVMYTYKDQELLFQEVYGLETEQVKEAIKSITTINKSFKVSADPVNLILFYTVHRFANEPGLNMREKNQYIIEALNYFNMRTLIVLISNYFIYPIKETDAILLIENLSNRYIIKQKDSWKDYTQYRSEEFIKSKFYRHITRLKDDDQLVKAINDLYTRTKDTLKNIYKEMLVIKDNKDRMTSRKNSVKDIDGKDVLLDKTDSAETYIKYLHTTLNSDQSFIKHEAVEISVSIIKTLNDRDFKDFLEKLYEFSHKKSSSLKKVHEFSEAVLLNAIEYLMKNKYIVRKNINLVNVIDRLSGNILYSRGDDVVINDIKDQGDDLVKEVMPRINDRKAGSLRNGLYVYICVRAFAKDYFG